MPPTKWGIVSAGKICHDFVSCLNTMPAEEHQVVAVAGRNFQNAQRFAQLHNIAKVYPSYEELAQDDNVEVAYIGSLNPDHRDSVMLMLESGKHVLCEKPLAMNVTQTEEMLRMAAEKKLFLMEGIWSRFVPMRHELRKELERGTIGEPRYIQVTAGYDMRGHMERVFSKAMGGSITLTGAMYCLELMLEVFGGELPQKMAAVADLTPDGVDQACAVSLRFSGGRLASFIISGLTKMPAVAEIVGEKGTIRLRRTSICPTEMETPHGVREIQLPPTSQPCNYINSSGLRYEADEVRRCLLGGLQESPGMPHKDSRVLAELMAEILDQVGVDYVKG